MNIHDEWTAILQDISFILSKVEETKLEFLVNKIQTSKHIFLIGTGRSRMILTTFCMRLRHLGFHSFVVGDLYCPPTTCEDIAIIASGSGKTSSTLALTKKFKEYGGHACLLTGEKLSPLGEICNIVIEIPASTSLDYCKGNPIMRSAYEQTLFIILEALTQHLSREMESVEITSRHANIE